MSNQIIHHVGQIFDDWNRQPKYRKPYQQPTSHRKHWQGWKDNQPKAKSQKLAIALTFAIASLLALMHYLIHFV